jgi:hypothetical protein
MRENDRLKVIDPNVGKGHTLIIESFSRFYPHTSVFSDFKPTKEIAKRVNERIVGFDEHVVGVHIRRTDNKKSVARSPDEAFIAQMRVELENDPEVRFYLATDSAEVKQKFAKIFGDKIITTQFFTTRTTVEGVQEALVELYALAATRKILGSYWSSYSTTAAELSGIPLHRVVGDR